MAETAVTGEVLSETLALLREIRGELQANRRVSPAHEERERYLAAQARPPERISAATLLQAIPGMAGHFDKRVPDEFWNQVADRIAEVACPCGATPRVSLNGLQACDCDRIFLHAGDRILVARTAETDSDDDDEAGS